MGNQPSTMKAFIFSSALLAVAMADTCTDCTAVVSTIGARLMSEESLAAQGAILVSGLCPGVEDPTAEWMCADICAAPEDVAMTCDNCKMGIQAAIDQLLSEEAMDVIVENIAPQICENNPTETCPVFVDGIIRNGLPLLAGAGADADFAQACNAAVEGTCPARKLRLF